MPLFYAKKEVFKWLKEGRKTIDIRKGKPKAGDFALFVWGPNKLKMRIVKTNYGTLEEIVLEDNFRQVIPSAEVLNDALDYLRSIYGGYDGFFTAYRVTL